MYHQDIHEKKLTTPIPVDVTGFIISRPLSSVMISYMSTRIMSWTPFLYIEDVLSLALVCRHFRQALRDCLDQLLLIASGLRFLCILDQCHHQQLSDGGDACHKKHPQLTAFDVFPHECGAFALDNSVGFSTLETLSDEVRALLFTGTLSIVRGPLILPGVEPACKVFLQVNKHGLVVSGLQFNCLICKMRRRSPHCRNSQRFLRRNWARTLIEKLYNVENVIPILCSSCQCLWNGKYPTEWPVPKIANMPFDQRIAATEATKIILIKDWLGTRF